MLRERTFNRFRFGCALCGHSWTVDYEVQHSDDGHGLEFDSYSLHGCPVTAPTARGVVRCPQCDASPVHVELVWTRTVAPVDSLRPPAEVPRLSTRPMPQR